MKKVYIRDNYGGLVDIVLEKTDWIIAILFTSEKNKKKYTSNERIDKIFIFEEFINGDRIGDFSGFSFDDILKYSLSSYKNDIYTLRFYDDFQKRKWVYYSGAAEIIKAFTETHIDAVIIDSLNHGHISDYLPVEYAKENKIPCFNIEAAFLGRRLIYDNLRQEILKSPSKEKADVYAETFYTEKANVDAPVYNSSDKHSFFWELIYRVGGYRATMFANNLLIQRSFIDEFGISYREYKLYYKRLEKARRFYDKHSVDLDDKSNYIVFMLHFEPEAAFTGKTSIDSQLVYIRILDQLLPHGWKLYVKEHPHQFLVNKRYMSTYFRSAGEYKTQSFYELLTNMEHVQLLKRDINSKDILSSCRAVATGYGNIAVEAAQARKPVMIFTPKRTVYSLCDSFLCINSFDDCKKAIDVIQEKKEFLYNDFEKIGNEYTFSEDKQGYLDAITVIKKQIDEAESVYHLG